MFRKLVAVAMVAALMAGASGSYAHGADTIYDLAGGTTLGGGSVPVPPTGVVDEAVDTSIGASATVTNASVESITTTGTGNIGIGWQSDGAIFGGTSTAFDLTVDGAIDSAGDLTIGGEVRELTADSIKAGGNITVTGENTMVTAGQLIMDNAGARTILIDNNGTLKITDQTTLEDTGGGSNTFDLMGSNASFAGGLTVTDTGQLNVGASTGGTAVSNLAVGARNGLVGGLRVESTGVFVVDGGATLNVLEALADPAVTTAATEVKYGDIVLTGTGDITMGANSTVNAGVLLVDGTGTTSKIDGTGTGSVLNLEGLTVAVNATFTGREGVRINGGVGDIQGTRRII